MSTGTRTCALALLLTTALSGCSLLDRTPDVEPAAEELAQALQAGQVEQLEVGFDQVDDLSRTVTVVEAEPDEGGATATATLRWSWDLGGLGIEEPWAYETRARLDRDGDGWAPRWSPALVHDDLEAGATLDVRTTLPARGDIVGAGGEALVTLRDVARFGIARDRVPAGRAAASARRLSRLLDIDAQAFVARVEAAGPKAFVEGLVLRAGDVPPRVDAGVSDIRGAFVVRDQIPLGPTPDFAEPILGTVGQVTAEMIEEDPALEVGDVRGLSGLQARYDEQLLGTPGWEAVAVGEDGEEQVLDEDEAVDGDPLQVSLDLDLQRLAEEQLAGIGPASALVAIRPSDGAILAAANGPGSGGVNLATYGQAAPGSTFKIVTALALLRAGLAPQAPVQCPDSLVVDGKRFENYDDYPASALGRIPLATALAQSCNTAFIGEADEVRDSALADAAASLGLGVDHDLGFPAYFGQVPPPESPTEAAADTIGQGGILASPMVMATVLASVERGETVVPWLVDEVRSEVPGPTEALTAGEARDLRTMLRGVVTSGSGSALADLPGPPVLAKTGTAEFDRDGERLLHAWMVASQGDLAVAVFVDEGESGSRTAGPVLEGFLRAAR